VECRLLPGGKELPYSEAHSDPVQWSTHNSDVTRLRLLGLFALTSAPGNENDGHDVRGGSTFSIEFFASLSGAATLIAAGDGLRGSCLFVRLR
jgi:hypothetical protein